MNATAKFGNLLTIMPPTSFLLWQLLYCFSAMASLIEENH